MGIDLEEKLQILDEFLKRWPKEKIPTLTLKEYIDVDNQDTFGYWLEHKTRKLGSILGGDASKFGIYRRKRKPKGDRKHIYHGELYSWNKKFGDNEAEAFENVRSGISKVIDYVTYGDLVSIENLELADTLKWKVAFLYQNHNKPVLLNIYKKEVLRRANNDFDSGFAELYKTLMQKRGDKNVMAYGYEVWKENNLDSSDNISDLIKFHFHGYIKGYPKSLLLILESFCKLATQNNIDIYPVNIKGQFRVGRKEKNTKSGTTLALILLQKMQIKIKTGDLDTLTEDYIDSIRDDFKLWADEHPVSRNSYWPLDYNDDNVQGNSPSSKKEVQLNNKSVNQILYGPPGTGKTYATINKALEIIAPEFLVTNKDDRSALKARFDSLVKSNRIGFVTFHQSFSYEDFVEGIKASTGDGNQVSYDVEDGIFKQMCDAASSIVTAESVDSFIDVTNRKIWKMSLGNTLGDDAYIFEQCVDDGCLALGYGGLIDFSAANNRKEIAELYRSAGVTIDNESYDYNVTSISYFKNYLKVGDLVVVSDGNHKFRAIAEVTGDYYFKENETGHYCQLRDVKWLKQFSPSLPVNEIFNKNLSQQTIYRLKPPTIDIDKLQALLTSQTNLEQVSPGSFISNYKISSISNEVIEFEKPNGSRLPIAMSIINELVRLVKSNKIRIDDIKNKGVFEKVDTNLEKYLINGYPNLLAPLIDSIVKKGISTRIVSSSDKRVLIIDEINRGNIANIFGELITLIEPSKRTDGDETITVKLPYSKTTFSVPSNLYLVGTMNTADKSLAQVDIALRRRFEFIEMMTDYDVLKTIPKIEGINIERLVETINQRIELLYDREHTIGHSFFLPLKDEPTLEKLTDIFELQILPLLEEYFFEDWERVGQVLGDHLKSNNDLRFIIEKFESSQISKLMGNEWDQSGIQPYIRNDNALTKAQAYIGIYESSE